MHIGHSWVHSDMSGFNFGPTPNTTTTEAAPEEMPAAAPFADSERNTVINNSGGTAGPTTIGFHSETVIFTFVMFFAICLVAALLYAYQRIKGLRKKVKFLKEELAVEKSGRRGGGRRGSN